MPIIQGIKFVYLYKLCFSPSKGTIYSNHRIESPNLQLKMAIEYKIYSHSLSYMTKIDKELEAKMNTSAKMQVCSVYNEAGVFHMILFQQMKH